MKIIYPDNVTAVLASSEASGGYYDDNVLDDWPDSVWKAGATTAQTLTVTVAAPDAVYVGYTNYPGPLDYTAKNSGGGTVESGSLTAKPSDDGSTYHYFYEPASPSTITSVVFSFDAVSGAVMVGCVRAGDLNEFQNLEYNANEGNVSHGVLLRTNNGGRYVLPGFVSRVYSGTVLTQNTYSVCQLVSLSRRINMAAFGCVLIEDTYDICGLYFFDGEPEASKIVPGYNKTKFTAEEQARSADAWDAITISEGDSVTMGGDETTMGGDEVIW